MIVVLILAASTCLFRALGVAGFEFFATWQAAARGGLAVMLLFTAAAHFNRMRSDLIAMVPPSFPRPDLAVSITGVLEALAAIGILVPETRALAGLGLILLLLALLPANVSAARRGLTLGGKPVTPLALRVPMQLAFIALAWWTTQPAGVER
jgi:uncharacterized membrane protein